MPEHTPLLGQRPLKLEPSFLERFAETLPTCLQAPELGAGASTLECPSEDEILNFTAGQLEPETVRRIDDHLAVCSTCSRVISDLLGEFTPPSATHPVLVPCVFPPGTMLARRFAIEGLIGRGGMGEVYAALDMRSGRTVAIKTVLAARCDSRRAMARLVGELHATRTIEHPNVCRARGMGTHGDASHEGACCRFIVMDYIQGETLGRRARREGPLPLSDALSVGRQILLALKAVHAAGIVHLDVKSDNVMLRASRELVAVLIDFGLARAISPDTFAARPQARGTVSYMAPEQLSSQPVGPHTDVFGFGVVMYELLTGAHPFCSQRASVFDTRTMLETRTLRPGDLPLRPRHQLPGLAPSLDDFVAGCTAPDPVERFSDASTALDYFDSLVS